MAASRSGLTYGAWCVCSGLWIAACGSTESDVDDDTGGTTPSTESTSSTNGNGGTSSDAGGASSSSNSSGNATTATGSGGASGSANDTNGSTGTGASTTMGGSMDSGGSTADGGSANAGGSTSNGGAAGNGGSTDAGGSAGNGGSTDTGGSAGNGGSAGTGGSSGTGGSPVDCGAPYVGPIGGKRPDGPSVINEACAEIDDDVIIARYDNPAAKVPQGLYWEPPGIVSSWGDACSESLNDTVENAEDLDIGEVEDQFTSDWSYEVSLCQDDDRRFYSDIRCDYFDGTILDGDTVEDLAYLASLLWWIERGNLTGAQILGYNASIGSATDTLTMCTIRTSYGDFGICDRITLEETKYSIRADGRVTIGERESVRSIQGDCD